MADGFASLDLSRPRTPLPPLAWTPGLDDELAPVLARLGDRIAPLEWRLQRTTT